MAGDELRTWAGLTEQLPTGLLTLAEAMGASYAASLRRLAAIRLAMPRPAKMAKEAGSGTAEDFSLSVNLKSLIAAGPGEPGSLEEH